MFGEHGHSDVQKLGRLGLAGPTDTPEGTAQPLFSSLKAEGYAEGDLTLYHRTSVTDFLRAANPVDFLSKASEVSSYS